MPELLELYQNDPSYASNEFISNWYYVADTTFLTYTHSCSKNHTYGFEWTIDVEHEIFHTDNYDGDADTYYTQTVPLKGRFVRFYVKNIASTPSELKTQVFFSHSNQVFLENIGNTGAGVYAGNRDLRKLYSSDSSVVVTENSAIYQNEASCITATRRHTCSSYSGYLLCTFQ